MKLYIVYSDKQFQLVDSVLFGQVRLAVCDVVETFFSDKDGSKIEKWSRTPMPLLIKTYVHVTHTARCHHDIRES